MTRDIVHSKNEIPATFILAREDPAQLGPHQAQAALSKLFAGLGGSALGERFSSFVAFIEAPAKGTVPPADELTKHYPLPGRVAWVKLEAVQAKLQEKLDHNSPQYKKKGTPSTRATEFFNARTLGFVMGSQRFIAENLDLYLERTRALGDQTWDLMKDLYDLQPLSRSSKSQLNYIEVRVTDKAFYGGNIDALIEMLGLTYKVRTTGELLDELNGR